MTIYKTWSLHSYSGILIMKTQEKEELEELAINIKEHKVVN